MEWYYEHNGQQAGPVSRAEMIRLIVQRRIHPNTLVWTPEFGDHWRPAGQAGLISPISINFMSPGEKNTSALMPSMLGKTLGPKTEPAQVPSIWSWFLLLPGVLNYLLYGADLLRGVDPFRSSVLELFCMIMILMTALILDRKTLAQHGYRPPTFLWFFLWGLCPPCYLWSRYMILKRGMVQAILAVALWAGMVGIGGYYLYQHPEIFRAQFEEIEKRTTVRPDQSPKVPAGKVPPAHQRSSESGHFSDDGEIQL